MDDIRKDIEAVEKDVQYFDKMIDGAEKLIRPWKLAIIWLAIALILSNLTWGIVHGYAIHQAYQSPIEIEQSQDFPAQQQEQSVKGAN